MKRVANLVFVAIFAYGVSARPADLDSFYKTQRISTMLSEVISGKYDLEISKYDKEDRELLALLKSPAASRLKILTKDNQLILQFETKAAALLEFNADRIYLNGSELKLNPTISISQNLKNWTMTSKKIQKTSKYIKIWSLLSPSAYASATDDQAWETAKNIVFAGIDTFQTYKTVATTSPLLSAAVANGAAASVGTAAVVTTAAVVAALVLVAVVACDQNARAASLQHQTKKSQELLNCFSKPLSWIGKNPRDLLFLQNLSCPDPNTVFVEFESQSHQKIRISLSFLNGQYMRSMPTDVEALERDPKLTTQYQKWFEDKKLQKKMEADALYFQQVCKDPAMLAAFRKAVSHSKKQGHVFTGELRNAVTGTR